MKPQNQIKLIDSIDIFPLLNNGTVLLIRIIQPFIQRNFAARPDRTIRPFASAGRRGAAPAAGPAPPHLAYFAIYTPVVGHVPCALPSVTSDAALGN